MQITEQMCDEYERAHGGSMGTNDEVLSWYSKVKFGDVATEDLHIFGAESINTRGVNAESVETIQAERQNDYGDAGQSFDSIAGFWNEYLKRRFGDKIKLDRVDVANMLELMKMSRFAYQRKHDSALDKAAYSDFTLQFTEK